MWVGELQCPRHGPNAINALRDHKVSIHWGSHLQDLCVGSLGGSGNVVILLVASFSLLVVLGVYGRDDLDWLLLELLHALNDTRFPFRESMEDVPLGLLLLV